MKYTILGDLGDWTFYHVHDRNFNNGEGRPLFAFTVTGAEKKWADGAPRFGELYATLEHAMVSAVGEKYTGPRGAGGTGVGTAADWFMNMIGANQIQAAGREGTLALRESIRSAEKNGVVTGYRVEKELDKRGVFLAKQSPEPYRSE